MKVYEITPIDRLFFRQNSSFDMTSSSFVKSVFPPSPSTLVGMARSTMAFSQFGWPWDKKHSDLIGDQNDLKGMKFRGPYVKVGDDILFPLPSNFYINKEEYNAVQEQSLQEQSSEPIVRKLSVFRLKPSSCYRCSIGESIGKEKVKLLQGPNEEGKVFFHKPDYIKLDDLRKILEGGDRVDNISLYSELWKYHDQVGNRLSQDKTTEENSLFSRQMVVLKSKVSLVFMVENGKADLDNQIATLGGESRLVNIRKLDKKITFPSVSGSDRFTITFITPAYLGCSMKKVIDRIKKEFQPAEFVSTSIPKPTKIGGWDIKNRQPKVIRPYLSVGTVFYFENGNGFKEDSISMMGDLQDHGYGQYLIGKW